MIRNTKATQGRTWWMKVPAVACILVGLAAVDPLSSRADLRHDGGFVRLYSRDRAASPQSPPQAMPPSIHPDNDGDYPFFSAAGVLQPPPSSPASMRSYYLSPEKFPWNQGGFADYDEPLRLPQDRSLSTPKKYALEATSLSPAVRAGQPEAAMLIVYLPEHASFWVEGTRTRLTGRTRYFQSPPLQPGRKYGYTVRATWIESDRWVSQTRTIPIQAGMTEAVYLRPAPAPQLKTKPESLTPPTKAALKAQAK